MFIVQLIVCLAACHPLQEEEPQVFKDRTQCVAYAKSLAEEIAKELPTARIGYGCVPRPDNTDA